MPINDAPLSAGSSLCGIPLDELTELLNPLPRYRAAQVFKWIARGVIDFSQMTDIPDSLREHLQKHYCVYSGKIESRQNDRDSMKLVLAFPDNVRIESVLLSDGKKRLTACLSTQAGCPIGCVFCKTGNIKFNRNLSSSEIVEQLLYLRAAAAETGNSAIDNIVIMGMGEPMLNMEQLRRAITVITEQKGMNFSKRRITISTCGIYEGINDLANNGPKVRLAISLVTGNETLRQELMPGTKTQSLAKIKEAVANFQKAGGGRVTLEAVLLDNVNMRHADAEAIAEFAKGLETVVNLIPWNPADGLVFNGLPLHRPEEKEVKNYARMLEKYGLKVTVRLGKGGGILGACGQLGSSISEV